MVLHLRLCCHRKRTKTWIRFIVHFLHGCTPLSLLSQETYKNMHSFHSSFFAWLYTFVFAVTGNIRFIICFFAWLFIYLLLYTFVFAVTVAGKVQNMNPFHIVLIAWWLRAEF